MTKTKAVAYLLLLTGWLIAIAGMLSFPPPTSFVCAAIAFVAGGTVWLSLHFEERIDRKL